MLELSNDIQKRTTSFIEVQASPAKYTSLKQKLIAIACISFFPLVYLIGSTIVKYF